jgi:prevent-host-death family protein
MKNPRCYSVAEAKSKFSEVLVHAKDEPLFISSRGKEIGVVMSKESYDRLLEQEHLNLPRIRIQNFLALSRSLSSQLPLELKLPKRKSRKSPNFRE